LTATIHLVAGARPNFMKVGPLFHALSKTNWADPIIVHTGQHQDRLMSDVFLNDFGLPDPHINLDAGRGTHAETTAAVMVAYERLCAMAPPDYVVVVGDVNSTVAAALTAKKLLLPVAHLEAGLRSFDRSMPEEINRIVTDAISDLLWTPSEEAGKNLEGEGIQIERIACIGNIMIDAYTMLGSKIRSADTVSRFGLSRHGYGVVTLHRPFNVDDPEKLTGIMGELARLADELPLVFPVHPRTRKALDQTSILPSGVMLVEPMGYVQFMNLVENAVLVITDSGGIQEETSYLGIPCLTLRPSTERPVTISKGTNRLIHSGEIVRAATELVDRPRIRPSIPLWDGQAALRATESLRQHLKV
jgi:UDP-N-acetylglucosamine 2-epimerase (non-hydrolysing)